ncbi:MAG: response regulator transcription factor [Terracidiphilus sp.]
MTTRGLTRRLAVCPISMHPGLLTTMERLLAGGDFKVMPLRLERDQNLGPHPGPGHSHDFKHIPHASVFVLDGSSLSLGTETLIEQIRSQYPQARLLVTKETSKDAEVFPYLRLGARGVVRYADAENELANAVKAVAEGDFWVHRKQLARFIDWVLSTSSYRRTLSGPGSLSRREREVLGSILEGLANKEIASSLNISERTVKFHVSHLLRKFGAKRRADLIVKQYQLWPAAS